MDRAETLDRLRALLAGRPEGIVCAYLFGSLARGEDRADSDVDLAVLLAGEPPATLEEGLGLSTAAALERSLGRAVDLVVLNTAPVDLVHRVLRDGVLLLDTDAAVRIRFEVAARNAYFDLLPTLREYRRGPRQATAREPEEAGAARAAKAVPPR
jgi:hypothetical protein